MFLKILLLFLFKKNNIKKFINILYLKKTAKIIIATLKILINKFFLINILFEDILIKFNLKSDIKEIKAIEAIIVIPSFPG